MLIAQAPTPEIPKLPADTPPIVQAVIYCSVAVILLVGLAGRYIGTRTKNEPAPTSETQQAVPATRTGPVAQQAEASQALMERLVAGLEKRLDEALATQHSIQMRYDEELDQLRSQLSSEQQANWRLSAQLQELHRQLEDARTEVIQLRAQLQAARPGPQGRQW